MAKIKLVDVPRKAKVLTRLKAKNCNVNKDDGKYMCDNCPLAMGNDKVCFYDIAMTIVHQKELILSTADTICKIERTITRYAKDQEVEVDERGAGK